MILPTNCQSHAISKNKLVFTDPSAERNTLLIGTLPELNVPAHILDHDKSKSPPGGL